MSCLHADRVFDALDAQFASSSLASNLTLDGDKIGCGMEASFPSLEYLRVLAQDPDTEIIVRDAIWAELVQLAQRQPEEWQLAAIWMMLPGLRSLSRKIFRRTRIEIKEIDSAVVTGFIEALRAADPQRQHLGPTCGGKPTTTPAKPARRSRWRRRSRTSSWSQVYTTGSRRMGTRSAWRFTRVS